MYSNYFLQLTMLAYTHIIHHIHMYIYIFYLHILLTLSLLLFFMAGWLLSASSVRYTNYFLYGRPVHVLPAVGAVALVGKGWQIVVQLFLC